MKQQYESEILSKLMERDGFNIPSSVPPYEAEIKAYFINQVKQAYPKLNDYEAEWLLYNYTKHIPADFPIESVSNVTTASFENVVPYAYQSAILKGNTLVNLSCLKDVNIQQNQTVKISTETVKRGTMYTFKFFVSKNNDTQKIRIRYYNGTSLGVLSDYSIVDGLNNLKVTTKTDEESIYLSISNLSSEINIQDFIILEGDYTNQDIPYFEGMQSVKMPVLTTTGKNLFDGEWEFGSIGNNNGLEVVSTSSVRSVNYINVKPNTAYVASSSQLQHTNIVVWYAYDKNKNFISSLVTSRVFTTPSNCEFIRVRTFDSDSTNISLDCVLQIEDGRQATSYEPYKSNILTTPEDLELRGIGDVKDELSVATGELTQRIGEVVLDGSEDWSVNNSNNEGFYSASTTTYIGMPNSKVICDKLPSTTSTKTEGVMMGITTGKLMVSFNRDKTGVISLETFKAKLAELQLKVCYELATESVQTVDLTTVNEKGEPVYFMPIEGTMHVTSSGETITPTFDMSVPVEATTQNLASFIDMEME